MKPAWLLGLVMLVMQPAASTVSANSPELLQDPMKPPALAIRKMRAAEASKNPQPVKRTEVQPPPPPLVLQSIIFSPDRQIAIINDLPVISGERVEGAKVVAIKKDRVTLVRKGKKLELMLDSDSPELNKTNTKSEL